MVNLQQLVNQRNPVTVYSPTRVLNRGNAHAGTAQRILQSRAAPPQYQPRAPSFQLGAAPQQAMPNTAAPGGNLDRMLALARAGPGAATQPEEPGGFTGFLGHLVNSPVGHAAMGALTVLDYPRRIVASGVQEVADAFNGGDASWDDFTHQVHEGIGFGDIIGSTGNIWLDRGIGFLGDVALDPLTYVGGAGVLAGTGREARAGLAARVLEMGLGEDMSRRVGRYGIHALSDAEREMLRKAGTNAGGIFAEGAEKVKRAGYYFKFPFSEEAKFRIPGTGLVDRFVGGGASRARAGLAASPLGGWLRHRNTDQVLVQAINRLVAGEGDISLAAAAEAYNWHQAFTLGSRMSTRQAETALKLMLDKHGADGLNAMVKQAEEVGGTPLNEFFAQMAKVLDDMKIEHGTIPNYIPHYYTDVGKAWLDSDTTVAREMAAMFGAGNSLEDFNPSLLKRHFVPREQPYIINGKEFYIRKGSIDEINSEFRRVTGEQFNLLEDNFTKIATRYGEALGGDVGRMTGVLRLLKSKTGLLRNANDSAVLKSMVDDTATALANQDMKRVLADQLNQVGEAAQQLSEELAKGLHHVGSDLLKARFGTIIDNLTSLTAADKAELERALDVQTIASRLLGTTSARGEQNTAGGQLLEALNARIDPMIAKVAALANERATLQRAATLERNQLVSALSVAKGRAAFDEIPQRLANLERYQTVTKQLLEAQRDLSVVHSLREQLQNAAAMSRAAAGLETDTSFLSQFLPGEAERIAIAATTAGQARATARAVHVAVSPLDPANIAREASEARQAIVNGELLPPGFTPTPEYTGLVRQAEEASKKVDLQHAAVLARTEELDVARSQYGPQVAAANANNAGVVTAYGAMTDHYDSLLGEPGRDAEVMQLEFSMDEFRRGPVADARNQIEAATKPIKEAETALDEERRALAKLQSEFIFAAKAIDEHAAIPQALPALPMSQAEHAEASRQLAQLRAEQQAYEQSPAARRVRQAEEKQAAVRAEQEQVSAELAARQAVDADGNVVIRQARSDVDYQMALARDDAQKEFDTLSAKLDATRADYKAYSLLEEASPRQQAAMEGRVRELTERLEKVADRRDRLNARLARDETALVVRRDRLAKTDRNLTELLDRAHDPAVVARRDNIENLAGKVEAQRAAAAQRSAAEAYQATLPPTAVDRAVAGPARDRTLGLVPRTDTPIARPNEARARMIDAEMRRKVAQRERTIARVTEQASSDVAAAGPVDIGVRALGSDDRLAWEHAQAIIRERDSFPGGESNRVVQQARRTIKELRPKVGAGVAPGGDLGPPALETLHAALDEIHASRTAWKPPRTIRQQMDDVARGVRTQGGDNTVQSRARQARSWGIYTTTEVKPDLVSAGALPAGSDLFGHPDIPTFIADANAELDAELKAFGTSPTALGKERLENAAAKVNRWSEFQLRYKAALDAGVTPSNQTATFIWSRVLGGESENLGAQIDNLTRRAAAGGRATGRLGPDATKNVIDHIASTITGEVQRSTAALGGVRGAGHDAMVAGRMAEHANQLSASIEMNTGRIEAFQRGHERLARAVDSAIADGSDTVRWQQPADFETMVPVAEAERMLANGEVADNAQLQVQRALTGARRRGEDVVSSRAFERRGPGGVREMPLAEAQAEVAKNAQTLESLRQGLADDKLNRSIIDGTITTEVAIQQAIIADQTAAQLPDIGQLQAELDALNRQALERQGINETGARTLADPTDVDVDASQYMTPDEVSDAAVLGQRIEAIRRFDKMTPEQLSAAQSRLADITDRIDGYHSKMAGHPGHADAIADNGQAFFTDLLDRAPTAADTAVMRDLIGPAQADVATAFIHQVNGILAGDDALTPERIGEVFTGLGTDFGDIPLLAEMRRQVVAATDAGTPVTAATFRDVVTRSLVSSAEQHKAGQVRNLNQMFEALGIRFTPGVKGLSDKLSAVGHVVGTDTVDQDVLRTFVARQFEGTDIPVDAQLEDTLTQLRLRKSHVDAMRLGLGADLRNMPWEQDPRRVFESAAAGRVDDEIRQFDAAVPQRVEQIYTERIHDLHSQLSQARQAGDTNRVNELHGLLDDLDGRRRVDPNTPPSAIEPAPLTNPQQPFEQQLADAEAKATQAANAATEARTRAAQNSDDKVARSTADQAEQAADEAKTKLDELRSRGPQETTAVETPEKSLGDADAAVREGDPDAALTFDEAHSEYEAAMAEVHRLDAEPPSPELDQARAAAAARARKMADQRSRQWPARKAELEQAVPPIPPGTVTWNVWHTMTSGAPNTHYTSRSLPELERGVLREMQPAEDIRQTMIEARNAAELERTRIQQHLDAYEGRDIDGEIARLQVEKEGLEAANARPLGEATYDRAAIAARDRDIEVSHEYANEEARIFAEQQQQRQAIREAEQAYTDQLRSVSDVDAKVRDKIHEVGARIHNGEAKLKPFEVLDYQGVNGNDMAWHAYAMRGLNKSVAAGTPEDAATFHMIDGLLNSYIVAAHDLERMEGRKLDVARRLKDFESGAESVGNVITKKIADGWRPMFQELIDPNGPDAVVMAEELARAIGNMDAALRKPEAWGVIDQFTRLFKTYATATPGFHVRNAISGVFMNYVDNVRTGSMLKAVRVWDRFMKDPFGYFDSLPENSDERRALMVVFGSGAAGPFVDTGDLKRGFGEPGSRLMNNRLTRWNQRAGSRVEGALRLGMALDSMAKGQNVAAALERVTRFHFDYSRLSTFDHTARRLIPFWTFMSRNIPLQIESMWLRPATYLHYQSFVRNFGEAADPLTPDYWLSQGAFTMDEHAAERDSPWYLAPDLPFLRVAEPLDALAHGDLGRGLLSNFNPAIAAPIEAFAAHRKFYSGAPVEEEYNAPSAAMTPLMRLLGMLPFGGTAEGGTSGDMLLDDRYAHIARSVLPQLNLLERLTNSSGTREGRTDETALRALGFPVYQLNDPLRESTAAGHYYDRRDAARQRADLARK